MAPVAAFGFQAQRTKGEVQVVGDHEQVLQGYFFLVEPVLHRPATSVHIRGRFEAKQGPAFYLPGADFAQAGRFKGKAFRPGQVVEYPESDVVAGFGVFIADVAEPRNQEFLHGVCFV